ncbi:translocation/assembly module TamB domain-containing protein [Geminocystis sp. NIES-3709]|uniref:translocation/assembly module TamB domain-containing protein n=1 Tax=Geminocystis sp. NIES-3709 TaxID=1617448 RepID=UPI0005FC4653|nr:translocation/assembly module TamB domain-containing protein [Geminocystis sp. NIES-3709]BAQ64196.1 protein of unknown function DUF490 [Geminocystis sp. NIES-3709]
MTNRQPEDWENNLSSLSLKQRLAIILAKPQTKIISLVTVTGILAGGYGVTRYLINKIIPSRIETELERILSREVSFGKVTHSLFNEIVIDNIKISPTQTDPSFLSIESAKISLDLWSLIFQRQLPINVIANEITGYGQLDTLLPPEEERKPFPLSLKLPTLPIEAKINLRLRGSRIGISPNATTQAVEVTSKGRLNLVYDNENQPLTYNLENRIGISRINLEGKTLLADTASENQLEIRYLDLPQATRLIPNLPLNLREGRLNGNLKIITSSLSTININDIEGKVNIQDVEGKVDIGKLDSNENKEILDRFNLQEKIEKIPLFNQNFLANAFIEIKKESLNIEYASLKIGDIDTSLRGEISQQQGYNLQANLNPVNLRKVLPSVGIKPIVAIDGLLAGNIQVNGNLDTPQIEGKVKVNKTFVDKLELGNIDSQFIANLDKVTIKQIAIKPPTGGNIITQGVINTNFNQNLREDKPLKLEKIPFNFQFNANLPSSLWSNKYSILSSKVSIAQILAKGEIKGNLSQPLGEISFSLPSIQAFEEELTTEGKLVIDKNTINLVDTQLILKENRILLNGSSQWREKTYGVTVVSDEINLTPFLSPLCQTLSFCDESLVNVNVPTFAKNLDIEITGNLEEISLNKIEGNGRVNLLIDNKINNANSWISNSSTRLISDEGNLNLNFNLAKGDLTVNGEANQIFLNNILPSLPNLANIINSEVNLTGNTQDLLTISSNNFPESLIISTDSKLQIEEGLINATASIDENETRIFADVSQIPVNQIIPSLPLDIESSQLNFSAKTTELYQLTNQSVESVNYETLTSLPSLNVTADINGKLAGGDFNSKTIVKNSQVSLDGFTQGISLSQLFPNTNLKAENLNGNLSLSSNVSDLVAFSLHYLDNQTLSSIPSLNLLLNGNANIAQGKILLSTRVNNNQWQSRINTRNVNLEALNQQLSLINQESNISLSDLDNLNGEINFSGSLLPVLQAKSSLPIDIESAIFEIGKNIVEAKGNFNLVNLFSSPDVNNLQLQVTANSNLNVIPVNQLLASVSSKNKEGFRFLPTSMNLDGRVNFQGVVKANSLLSNLLGENNIDIQGDLTLTNFNFNQLDFDSFLKGKLIINSSIIDLDLRGSENVIAFSLLREDFTIPAINVTTAFFPSQIEIRQGRESGFSLIGKRLDNEFNLVFSDFALENLQLQPAINYGVKGKVRGILSSDITVNLSDFSATGNLNLDNLGLGGIVAKNFSTNFNFADDIAQLENAKLSFANTNYDLEGKINVVTQAIEGRMSLNGRVEDIFSTLQITDVDSVNALLQHLQSQDFFASADTIPSQSLGGDKNSIKSQVNLLYIIDQQIRSIARDLQSGKIPNDLDIRGKYEGEILLAGKLSNPEINVNFQGNQWQWLPQQNFPNIVDSLGLVIEETQFIPIEKIAFNASWENNNLALQPFELNIANSQVFFSGNISSNSQEGNFKVVDFPLNFIDNFVKFPTDIDSLINLNGKVSGNISNPIIIGDLSLNNTAINGVIIDNKIQGNFDYKNYQLNFNTVENQNIQINASIPYHPSIIENKPAFINIKLDSDRVKLLDILSQGKISLMGGNISSNLSIEIASINKLINNFKLELFKLGGEINFDNAQINSIRVKSPITLTGKVNIDKNNQALDIETLSAKINNSADINIAGNLPLFKPKNNNDNPLSINISNQKIDLQNIYSGQIKGDIVVNGTVFTPKIGGYVSLNNGNFVLPQEQTIISNPRSQGVRNQWLGDTSSSSYDGIFQPELKDFTLKLVDTQLAQWSLYRFLFGGELIVNGGLYNWKNLRADGAINVRRGQIYLGGANPLTSFTSNVGFGQTTFFLSRTNENTITFRPEENILNPEIDIEVQADIVDYSRQLPNTNRNEVLDPIVRGGRGENIQVVLRIDGGLAQLLPVLSGSVNDYCRLPSTTPIAEEIKLSSSQLNEVAECINLAALNKQGSNFNLLNSPLISLRSTPNRSEGELINLIVGGELLNLATQLQDLSSQDLFENGLVQFILVPLANNISFGVNEKVSTWGKPLGMKDLRVFPLVEGVYEVKKDSTVTVSYDYIYGEYKVRYQMRF